MKSNKDHPIAPAEDSDEHFTRQHYLRMVEALQRKGFRFAFFDGDSPSGRVVYLRHDIDLSLEHALAFAEIEAQAGITTTYFCMLDNPFYNPSTTRNRGILRKISDLGHELGLHFVPPVDHDPDQLGDLVREECSILGALAGRSIGAFSFHRPPERVLSSGVRVSGVVNAYSPEYFSPQTYISDSNHRWRCGNPLAFVEAFPGDRLQILTHPLWFTDQPASGTEKVLSFLEGFIAGAWDYLSSNIGVARAALAQPGTRD